MSATTGESRYRVTGMDCAACASKVDTAIRRIPGVEDVAVSVSAGTVRVRHSDSFEPNAVVRQVRGLGYGAEPAMASANGDADGHGDPGEREAS